MPARGSVRASVAAALALGAVAAVALLAPYRPVRVAGAAPAPPPYPTAQGLTGLRLHVFNTGTNRMSRLLVGQARPWRPAPAFVVEHPGHGLLVFDCGLSPEVARQGESALAFPLPWLMESRGAAGRTLDAQMSEAGLEPARVETVVISHLHEDHTGAARSFANATFIGGPGTAGVVLPGEFRPMWRELTDTDFTVPWAPFGKAMDLFGDASVLLLRGGGHAAEGLMALLALPGGPVLLAGDAVVHLEWLADDDVQRIAVDPERAAAVRNAVRAWRSAGGVVAAGHDLADLANLGIDRVDIVPHHVQWYAASAWPID